MVASEGSSASSIPPTPEGGTPVDDSLEREGIQSESSYPPKIGKALHISQIKPEEDGPRISTGSITLDNHLGGGFRAGRLNVFLAATAHGKTRKLIGNAADAAENGYPVLFVSAELGASQVAEILTPRLQNPDSVPFYVLPSRDFLDIADVTSKLADYVVGNTPPFVCVDYLQLIRPAGAQERREREVASVADSLAVLAKRTGTVILAAAQLNRAGMQSDEAEIYHARESGGIEQAADVVMIGRLEGGKLKISIKKNRWGGLGEAIFEPDFANLGFKEILPAEIAAKAEAARLEKVKKKVLEMIQKNGGKVHYEKLKNLSDGTGGKITHELLRSLGFNYDLLNNVFVP